MRLAGIGRQNRAELARFVNAALPLLIADRRAGMTTHLVTVSAFGQAGSRSRTASSLGSQAQAQLRVAFRSAIDAARQGPDAAFVPDLDDIAIVPGQAHDRAGPVVQTGARGAVPVARPEDPLSASLPPVGTVTLDLKAPVPPTRLASTLHTAVPAVVATP